MPVTQEDIDAALRYMTPTVQAMVRLQLLTGMRPSEARAMCCKDIDQTGAVWVYTPQKHKTQYPPVGGNPATVASSICSGWKPK